MAVYVDKMRKVPQTKRWRWETACHMVADTPSELHGMADDIGLKRDWFQRESTPHYDLTVSRRKLAVQYGALQVSDEAMAEKTREIRGYPRWRSTVAPIDREKADREEAEAVIPEDQEKPEEPEEPVKSTKRASTELVLVAVFCAALGLLIVGLVSTSPIMTPPTLGMVTLIAVVDAALIWAVFIGPKFIKFLDVGRRLAEVRKQLEKSEKELASAISDSNDSLRANNGLRQDLLDARKEVEEWRKKWSELLRYAEEKSEDDRTEILNVVRILTAVAGHMRQRIDGQKRSLFRHQASVVQEGNSSGRPMYASDLEDPNKVIDIKNTPGVVVLDQEL